jgi:ABC-type dipeptide/oligopeptide/nickel transport system permease subunit
MVATAWTLIVPVIAIALVVLTFNGAQRGPAAQ